MVLEFIPGRVKFTVSIVLFMIPDFKIYIWIEEGAEYTVTLNLVFIGTRKEGHCKFIFSLLATSYPLIYILIKYFYYLMEFLLLISY